jgi:hypothetical protein
MDPEKVKAEEVAKAKALKEAETAAFGGVWKQFHDRQKIVGPKEALAVIGLGDFTVMAFPTAASAEGAIQNNVLIAKEHIAQIISEKVPTGWFYGSPSMIAAGVASGAQGKICVTNCPDEFIDMFLGHPVELLPFILPGVATGKFNYFGKPPAEFWPSSRGTFGDEDQGGIVTGGCGQSCGFEEVQEGCSNS